MPKRKKYPKLPNGYGSIKYLGAGRRNPFGVYPPTKEFTLDGVPKTPKAICYVDTWIKGFTVLTSYKAGTYSPGMEKELSLDPGANLDALSQKILADYNRVKKADEFEDFQNQTFAEVYEAFYKHKYENPSPTAKKYSSASIASTRAAFKNCSALHNKSFRGLRYQDLQNILDNCQLKHASLELILSLFHQMYEYASIYDLCDKDYSEHLKINKLDDDVHGIAFTQDELNILWDHKNNPVVEFILIMCYSGYRISAFKTLEVNLEKWYFRGGVKTASGKNRIVPIHSAIRDLVTRRLNEYGCLLPRSTNTFRENMYKALSELGIKMHTPHDCRHTFSMLLEKYGANENDRKRLLGHSFDDLTNKVYGHRDVEDLRVEIEKIKVVTNL